MSVADFLIDQRDRVIERFTQAAEKNEPLAERASRPLLVDHLPQFLDEIAEVLRAPTAQRPEREVGSTARQHGEQRRGLGYDLGTLVREYGVLNRCLLEVAKEHGVIVSIDEFQIIGSCMNLGVAQATTAYIEERDRESSRQKDNLEFLLEAGELLSSSLDYRSTLQRLIGLLVPRMADWCALHFEGQSAAEMPMMHVDPAKLEALRALYERYPSVADGFKRVVETGLPSFTAHVDQDSWKHEITDPEQLALYREIGTVSWIVVPLRVQDSVFGAITLAYSESGRHYDETDIAFVSDIARRASTSIDNARLYELSQKQRSRVEAATRAKDEFVAMVSHELRTPLNAILGWLGLMRNGTLAPEKRQHALDVIERNAQAQNRVVSDLLDISRIITGQIRIAQSQVDFGNVVDMASEAVRAAVDAKRIHLTIEIERGSTMMRGDGERLQQVAWNLLANAVKFTGKNGEVRVSVRRIDSDLELTVEDNGVGIDREFLPHIFESFRQYDGTTARAHGGLGIGLSIARHIIELHGGTLTAESPGPDRGATFRARLPISPLVSTTMGISMVPATRKKDIDAEVPSRWDGVQVLVVDDEEDARDLVAYVLQSSGIEARTAGSAAEALEMIQSFTPDVLVSDIGMPHEDGYSLIRSVRTLKDQVKSRIPAIALTAFARSEDRTRALVEGFNLHLAKPVEAVALVNAVGQLARSGLLSEYAQKKNE